MQRDGDGLRFSASDLANHLGCKHLTQLDLRAARGEIRAPHFRDAKLEALQERGFAHEDAFLAHLRETKGVEAVRLPSDLDPRSAVEKTELLMRQGADVIVQASLAADTWLGRADILVKIPIPSKLGDWSYEVIDTKLARETRAETLLQLCLYAELVGKIQGHLPERIGVVTPASMVPTWYRTNDYLAYFRRVKASLIAAVKNGGSRDTYPDPVERCEVCRWSPECKRVWRADDHLSLVAGITRSQRKELVGREIAQVTGLASLAVPLEFRPDRGSKASYEKVREQARLQVESRGLEVPAYELREVGPELGLCRLPPPSPGDIFFDIEGDHFVGDRGLEYLFGVTYFAQEGDQGFHAEAQSSQSRREEGSSALELGVPGTPIPSPSPSNPSNSPPLDSVGLPLPGTNIRAMGDGAQTSSFAKATADSSAQGEGSRMCYEGRWAFTEAQEKAGFEWFVGFVEERRKRFPDLHIYHYAPYEPSAVKRLMGAYATCEDEVDDWLRKHLFVDLLRVVKESMIAGVEGYSIKDLEPLFGFKRQVELRDAGASRASLERSIETGLADTVEPEIMAAVLGYNQDDCDATLALRDWLESVRSGQILLGAEIPRFALPEAEAGAELTARRQAIQELVERLTADVPVDQALRTQEQQARWLLAYCLDYFRREQKHEYWEKFRLQELPIEDYVEEPLALAGLEFVGPVGGTDRKPIHRYRFPVQECRLDEGDKLADSEKRSIGEIEAVDTAAGTVDIIKTRYSKEWHPHAVHEDISVIRHHELENSLERLARWVLDHGLESDGDYRAARDLLLKLAPRVSGGTFTAPGDTEDLISETQAICRRLSHVVLPIQGPPGSGKTYLAARLISDMVSSGLKVGVTANSHKVISHLLNGVMEACQGSPTKVVRKGDEVDGQHPGIEMLPNNMAALAAIQGDADVLGATKFMWACEDFAGSVDVLVVDEASQMSLADILAISPAAKSVLLIGDPMQLERPQKGTHPPGVGVSSLDHLLDGEATIPAEKGIFLPRTRRLSPEIAKFTSEAFYDSRLLAHECVAGQRLDGCGEFDGTGVHFVPVEHEGNRSQSREETDAIAALVRRLLAGGSWTDQHGVQRALTIEDILIVAPYNLQVGDIRAAIPGARVGTVDKFQGQEAPVAIYSMSTSSAAEAPRGMEFLYSLNRLNVATSRARCAVIVVASPALLEVDCRTPAQMRLANALCRYVEMAVGDDDLI